MAIKRPRQDGSEEEVDLDEQLLNLLPEELQDSDEIYLDDEEDDPPSTRGGMLAIVFGILFGLLVAGVATWYLLGGQGGGVAEGPDDGLPQVTAQGGSFKERPEDPGGMTVENQDKMVYNRISEPESAAQTEETLLPEPEQPMVPPVRPVDGSEDDGAANGDTASAETTDSAEGGHQGQPAMPSVLAPAPEASDASSGDTGGGSAPLRLSPGPSGLASGSESAESDAGSEQPTATDGGGADMASTSGTAPPGSPVPGVKPSPSGRPASRTVTPPAATEPPASTPATPEAAPTQESAQTQTSSTALTGPQVQLAALKTPEAAERAWKEALARHGDLLRPLKYDIVRADLGDKGVFYRLRVGPLSSRNEAKALCATLKQRNQGCIVVR